MTPYTVTTCRGIFPANTERLPNAGVRMAYTRGITCRQVASRDARTNTVNIERGFYKVNEYDTNGELSPSDAQQSK